MLFPESFFNNGGTYPFFNIGDLDNNIVDCLGKLVSKCTEAIHNSVEKGLESKFEDNMNKLIICASRKDAGKVVSKRLSIILSDNEEINYHGTKHYK